MRILLISSGLRPDHFGGLPAHVENLLEALHAAGEEIGYLNVGKKSRWPFTRVTRRENRPYPAWDLSSSRSYVRYWTGTAEPKSQVAANAAYKRTILKVINEFRPQIVHFHELTSLPVGLFQDIAERKIKLIFSAHDFYTLCPTVKLLRPCGTLCERDTLELDCQRCCVSAGLDRWQQMAYMNHQLLSGQVRLRNIGRRAIRWIEKLLTKVPEAEVYQQRRRDFISCLSLVDAVLVTSRAQERIFRRHAGDAWKLHFLPLSRTTIRRERPAPRTRTVQAGELTFLALNIVNPAKGSDLLKTAFAELSEEFPNIELRVYGLEPGGSPGIRSYGSYDDEELDTIVAQADFGILPSVWPEAFGYVGPEMLSRGLPVIASTMGAMPDYIIDGVNGLLFDPSVDGDLAAKVRTLVSNATLRETLWQGAATGDRHYPTMGEHVTALIEIYGQASRDPGGDLKTEAS